MAYGVHIFSAFLVHLSQAQAHDTVGIIIAQRIHIGTGRPRSVIDKPVTFSHPVGDISA